jgi:serine/threonine-protein kinase
LVGDSILQYRVISRLGAGGMGEVYLAEDERLGRKVALKFLTADLAKDAEALERFRNEARLSAGLSHPNVASIHGFEESDGRWFHVHEYVEGETLERSQSTSHGDWPTRMPAGSSTGT